VQLTTRPDETLDAIYQFLDKEKYKHDFDHVEKITEENDLFHGIRNLHNFRSKVEPVISNWRKTLGRTGEPYAQANFWEDPYYLPELRFAETD
jgi:hypothetical protein